MRIGQDLPERADFYGCIEPPFSLSPDPRFFFESDSHRLILDALGHTFAGNHAFAIVTGDHGSGKTMLCRRFVDSLDARTFSSYVATPGASFTELLQTMLIDFGLVSRDMAAAGRLRDESPYRLLRILHDSLLSIATVGAKTVLIVDEAHHASDDVLEHIRVLSNLEDDGTKLLLIVLCGRRELFDQLGTEEALAAEARFSCRLQLTPLAHGELERYIAHRLAVSRPRLRVTFHRRAVDVVHALTRGMPRLVNQLCAESLAIGAQQRIDVIPSPIVEQAAATVFLERPASEGDGWSWRGLIPASEA